MKSVRTDIQTKHLERLPKGVKVGGYKFAIELAPPTDGDLEGDYGCTNTDTFRITLNEGMTFQKIVNVLWHELNHAIDYAYELEDSSSEEDFASKGATGWMALRIDNPSLDRWINRAIVIMRKPK